MVIILCPKREREDMFKISISKIGSITITSYIGKKNGSNTIITLSADLIFIYSPLESKHVKPEFLHYQKLFAGYYW